MDEFSPYLHDNITHILHSEIPNITIPHIDDVPVKGLPSMYHLMDSLFETIPDNLGISQFVWEHFCNLKLSVTCVPQMGRSLIINESQLSLIGALVNQYLMCMHSWAPLAYVTYTFATTPWLPHLWLPQFEPFNAGLKAPCTTNKWLKYQISPYWHQVCPQNCMT